jgi:UDPglucose 6-dehydrogenase
MPNAKRQLPDVTYCKDPYQAAEGVEAILVLTEWEEFRQVDWKRLSGLVERPLVVDGRNTLPRKEVAAHGFHYVGIGGIAEAPKAKPSLIGA